MGGGRVMVSVATAVAVLSLLPLPVDAQDGSQIRAGGAATKLGRGAVNFATGWVEIPKRIYETSQEQGAAAGFTWGLLRGIGYGFVRTAAGLYEVVTFPVPAPADYAPIMQPEFVFLEDGTASSQTHRSR